MLSLVLMMPIGGRKMWYTSKLDKYKRKYGTK